MSTYESTPVVAGPGFPVAPAKRPVTLLLAVWGSVAVGILTLVGAIVALVSGKESIRAFAEETVRDLLGADASSELINASIAAELDNVYGTLQVKAYVAIAVGVLTLVFALLANGGGKGARIGLAVVLGIGLCGGSGLWIADADALPDLTVISAFLSPLLTIAAIVLLFLPPTNRYAAAKAGR
jgi:hypothetical protein